MFFKNVLPYPEIFLNLAPGRWPRQAVTRGRPAAAKEDARLRFAIMDTVDTDCCLCLRVLSEPVV
eukprot:SAG31_NODE_46188_length_255_cov_1.000000_1_plen_64_part_01